jgi:hypothetical protein
MSWGESSDPQSIPKTRFQPSPGSGSILDLGRGDREDAIPPGPLSLIGQMSVQLVEGSGPT